MNGTDLDDHSFCCFKVASTVSLAALIEAEASVLDNAVDIRQAAGWNFSVIFVQHFLLVHVRCIVSVLFFL